MVAVVRLVAVVIVVTANIGFRVYGYTGFSSNSQCRVQLVLLQCIHCIVTVLLQ